MVMDLFDTKIVWNGGRNHAVRTNTRTVLLFILQSAPWLTPQQVSLLENIARAHDQWLSAGGRQPSVSVLQTVQEAVKGA
jgi:hypothetical protein